MKKRPKRPESGRPIKVMTFQSNFWNIAINALQVISGHIKVNDVINILEFMGVRQMILEIATIKIKPGMDREFEAAVTKAAPIFSAARGCTSMKLRRCLENPETYLLFVEWVTLENHTVDFRESENFQEWRKLIGDCLDGNPEAVHYNVAVEGF